MNSGTECTIALDGVSGSDPGSTGEKGAKLGELRRAGLPVPGGFVVTTQAFERFMSTNALWEKVDRMMAGADLRNEARLGRLSAIARTLLQASPIPKDVANGIVSSYRKLCTGGSDTAVAVRSSHIPGAPSQASRCREDMAALNVRGDSRVLGAVRRCWSSVFEPRTLSHCLESDPRLRRPAIAAVVQTLVRSEKAGLGSCVDLDSRDTASLLVESVFGYKDDLSASSTAHDSFVIDRGSGIVKESTVVDKRTMVVALDDSGLARVEVPARLRMRPSLLPEEVNAIWRLSGLLEKHCGFPQDFEWAVGGGSVSLLDARSAAVPQLSQRTSSGGARTRPLKLA